VGGDIDEDLADLWQLTAEPLVELVERQRQLIAALTGAGCTFAVRTASSAPTCTV